MRTGIVSDTDYNNGMVSVIYTDGDSGGGATDLLPCLNTEDGYKMPEAGQVVVIGKLSTGRSIVLGKLWDRANRPEKAGRGVYHKRLSSTAEISASGTEYLKLADKDIAFETDYGIFTVTDIIKRLEKLEGGF